MGQSQSPFSRRISASNNNVEDGMTLIARAVLLMLATLLLSGCYLMQAATGQMAISAKAKPIAAVIDNPNTKPALRRRLRLIADAREFASRELGLPDNKSYRNFVDLKRDYVVWNVYATGRFSVDARKWCFPIAGCVVYRGYFNEQRAQRYARHVRRDGEDAAIAGAAAYSTLGHFNDPVVSTMLRWSDTQIAAMLFHELAHQVYYVPNESAFNEAFASVVEEEGAKRWLAKRDSEPGNEKGNDAALQAWQTARSRSLAFSELLLTARERLRKLYASEPPSMALYDRKQQEFGRLKFDYEKLKASWNGYAGYDAWFNRALNNADLVSAATYETCVPGFERLLTSLNGNLPKFYEAVKRQGPAERHRMCEADQ